MPDSNEFFNRLINKNNDELDSLLSFADDIKKGSQKSAQSADSILDELSNFSEKKSASSYQVISAASVSEHTTVRNFHHIGSVFEIPEYKSYGSICGLSKEKAAPIITDEAENTDPQPADILPESITEKKVPHSEENPDSGENENYSETDSDSLSGAEKFIAAQENKHPRFYFTVGFIIFLVAVLGLVSCIYLGLTTFRNSKTIQSEQYSYCSDQI